MQKEISIHNNEVNIKVSAEAQASNSSFLSFVLRPFEVHSYWQILQQTSVEGKKGTLYMVFRKRACLFSNDNFWLAGDP